MEKTKSIYITDKDMRRLETLILTSAKTKNVLNLEEELGRAIIVRSEEISPSVVTMNSRLCFRDETSGEEPFVTLVYPPESDVNTGKISVLAPIGSALLGLSVGDEIEWPMPNGRSRTLRVISVIYQPEANGDFNL